MVSDESPSDWINGNFAVTSTSIFTGTYLAGIFTSAPNCQVTAQSTASAVVAKLSSTGATSTSVQVHTYNTSTSTAEAAPFTISCTKTGSDYIQPAVTAKNWNFSDRPFTVTATNAGNAIITGRYDRVGGRANFRYEITIGSTTPTAGMTLSLPPGLTFSSTYATTANSSYIHVGSFNNVGNQAQLIIAQANKTNNRFNILHVFATTAGATGSLVYDASAIPGLNAGDVINFSIPDVPVAENGVDWQETWNALQLNGSVVADTNVKADKAAGITSVDYGTYSAAVTAVTNISAANGPVTCSYLRIGSTVSVTCPTSPTCTTGSNTFSTYTVSVPIPTTQGATIKGVYNTDAVGETGVVGNSGNIAQVDFRCNYTAGPGRRHIDFKYQVP